MICSASQMDSFWKTFVLSNDCESSIRANVTEPPRFGVAARDPSAAVVQRAETARRIARDRRRVRALTFTPSDGGGLRIEGPVEEFSVNVPAVGPEELPGDLGAVLLAVKSQHTETALRAVAPRLAADGFVVSLQNGVNEPLIAAVVGEERTVGAFVNFGADYLQPRRIFVGGRGALYVGELDGRRSPRPERLLPAL